MKPARNTTTSTTPEMTVLFFISAPLFEGNSGGPRLRGIGRAYHRRTLPRFSAACGSAIPTALALTAVRHRRRGRIISTMTLKTAAFFALIGTTLLTVLLALGFIRDVSGFLAGALAAMALLMSLIHL